MHRNSFPRESVTEPIGEFLQKETQTSFTSTDTPAFSKFISVLVLLDCVS